MDFLTEGNDTLSLCLLFLLAPNDGGMAVDEFQLLLFSSSTKDKGVKMLFALKCFHKKLRKTYIDDIDGHRQTFYRRWVCS